MLKSKIILFAVIAGMFIYSGCSASSNSTRYGEKSTDDTHNTSDVRFSSDNDNDQAGNENSKVKDQGKSSVHDSDDSDPDDLPANEPRVDISNVLKKYQTSNSSNDLSSDNSTPRERMLMEILKYINTPYKYGGTSANGIDCSAFTQSVYNKSLAVNLDRTAREQYQEGTEIDNVNDLQFGDLVFFNTRKQVKPGHVGIYIGDHLFAHASKKGVTVSSLDMEYYSRRFMGGRRIDQALPSGNSNDFGSK
ncbi:MAG TPA: C40 family peptidase [Ignavibacteriaceae bacterium]|nr:C40 family peptidase [Ignavibacteriaceae bacterium]